MRFPGHLFYTYFFLTGYLVFACSLTLSGQENEFVLKGSVYSSQTGLPLRDINISTLNIPAEPASTDTLGIFEISLPDKNEQIVVSYPGYKTKIIHVDGRNEIQVWLLSSEDYSIHDGVQLVFRDVSSKDITGSAVPGRNLDIIYTSSPSIDQVLQGKLPGLHIINRSGMPGEGAYMHLWGYNSLFSAGTPLVIVDGMITRLEGFPNSVINGFHQNPLADINHNNISSVTLLKDASETVLYGLKGSNGVLIINTHPPMGGETTLDVSVNGGIVTSPVQIPVMEAGPYKSYIMEQMYNAGMSSEQIFEKYPFTIYDPAYLYYHKYDNNTNWQDEVFNNGILTDAYLRVKGGDARALYSLSGGYLKHEGIIKNTNYSRFNFRFNSLVNVSKRINVGINLGFTNGKYSLMESGALYQTNPIYASLIKSPNMTIFQKDQDGISLPVKEDIADFGFSNPSVLVDKVNASDNTIRFLGSSYMNVDITDNLSLRVNIGLNRDKANERIFIPAWGVAPQGDGSAERSMRTKVDQYTSLLNENRISYSNILNYIHDFSIDAGMRLMFNRQAQDYGLAQNSATDEFKNLNAGKSDERAVGGFDEKWNWLSYFTSARYKLKDRYMISLSVSLDGSSRFGENVEDGIEILNYPYVVLPAAGLAWRISGEPFVRNIRFIDELKVRASYGLTGSDEFGNYASRFYYVSVPYYSVSAEQKI